MPFTSKVDFKALDVAVRYCKLTKGYENSAIKKPDLDFGKWLVEVLYERQRLNDTEGWNSMVGRLMNEPSIVVNAKKGR